MSRKTLTVPLMPSVEQLKGYSSLSDKRWQTFKPNTQARSDNLFFYLCAVCCVCAFACLNGYLTGLSIQFMGVWITGGQESPRESAPVQAPVRSAPAAMPPASHGVKFSGKAAVASPRVAKAPAAAAAAVVQSSPTKGQLGAGKKLTSPVLGAAGAKMYVMHLQI